tara:strand:- start:3150 stop:4064 length:915 start_codon:yes stop_codon:yes gene_type:complete
MKSLSIIFKGLIMGISDLVPGISGGTIAFILGIYEEFIFSLSKLSISSIKKLKNEGFFVFWNQINGSFLLKLFSGILIGLSLFTYLIDWLINNYKIPLWAFFLGVLISSVFIILKKIKRKKPFHLLLFIIGVLISFSISQITPSAQSGSINAPYLFFSSFIAISAMMLPGISGAYILILFGTYSEVISVFKGLLSILVLQEYPDLNIILYKSFVIFSGIISGILIFSKFIKWLLLKYYDNTLVILIGLILGGLSKIWPWQENGEIVWPYDFSGENYLIISIILFIVGITLILGIDICNKTKSNA